MTQTASVPFLISFCIDYALTSNFAKVVLYSMLWHAYFITTHLIKEFTICTIIFYHDFFKQVHHTLQPAQKTYTIDRTYDEIYENELNSNLDINIKSIFLKCPCLQTLLKTNLLCPVNS